MIDRNNGQQAVRELIKLGQSIERNTYSACIFPEGTRSKTGTVRQFQPGGVRTLMKASPSALLIPFVIDGNYKLERNGPFPLSIGHKLTFTVLNPVERGNTPPDRLVAVIENLIKAELGQLTGAEISC